MNRHIFYPVLLLISLFLLGGCRSSNKGYGPDKPQPVAFSEKDADFDFNHNTKKIVVKSNGAWKIENSTHWVKVHPTSGEGNTIVTVSVSSFDSSLGRQATITVSSGKYNDNLFVKQSGLPANRDNARYKIPVVFHLLTHKDAPDVASVKTEKLAEYLKHVNERYKGGLDAKAVDNNVEFVLASVDFSGKPLAEEGIVRHDWHKGEIPYNEIIGTETKAVRDLCWDFNTYVNVFIFKFKKKDEGKMVTLGVATLPFMPEQHPVKGLARINTNYVASHNWKYTNCVVINSDFLKYGPQYISTYVGNTLAHELGHYVGLFHAFTEHDEDAIDKNPCDDTDHCPDTEQYDREDYVTKVQEFINSPSFDKNNKAHINRLFERVTCDLLGTFVSFNLMDYFYCRNLGFTSDQRSRVRQVLYHGLLVPGAKYRSGVRVGRGDVPENVGPPTISDCPEHDVHVLERML
ncbi:MAG: zinc-dependent metalloproteinase lipoprotein [Porphyromonas sp.]|nr:zinc-dependent metalloproteinase lipoprotein [Porphyromonas sp.]